MSFRGALANERVAAGSWLARWPASLGPSLPVSLWIMLRLLDPDYARARTPEIPRPESVTHVLGTLCRPCLRLDLEDVGGRDRVRTCDPLLAKQVLSQLSYTPTCGNCHQF